MPLSNVPPQPFLGPACLLLVLLAPASGQASATAQVSATAQTTAQEVQSSLEELRRQLDQDEAPPVEEQSTYEGSLVALITVWADPATEAAARERSLSTYKEALGALHAALGDEPQEALLLHGQAVAAWLDEQRARGRPGPRRWLVAPAAGGGWTISGPGVASRPSSAPLPDLWGADHMSPPSKNRPALAQRGDEILLRGGSYPSFKLNATYDVPGFRIDGRNAPPRSAMVPGHDPLTVVRPLDDAEVRILPRLDVGGTATCSLDWVGAIEFRDLTFVSDDRWTIGTERPAAERWHGLHPGVRDLRFFGCQIRGGRNFETNEGPKNKWAVLAYELGRSEIDDYGFVFAGSPNRRGSIQGIHKEHAFYLHNTHAKDPEDLAVLIEGVDVKWCGRTFVQFTARQPEGPRGQGRITIRDCTVEDVCMQPGGGGSAITLAGNHHGTVHLQDVRVHLGGNPDLHPDYRHQITGAFVAHHGDGSGGQDTREVLVEDCHFEVGPHLVGKGSARRPNMMIGAIGRFVMRGTTVLNHPGAREALRFDPATLGEVILAEDNEVLGDVYWGQKRFVDADADGDGLPDGAAYRALLAELRGQDGDGDGKVLDPAPVKVRVESAASGSQDG